MFAADVELAETILRHAGRLQDHRVERFIVAARLVENILRRDRIGRGTGLGLDAVARRGQAGGGDGDGFRGDGAESPGRSRREDSRSGQVGCAAPASRNERSMGNTPEGYRFRRDAARGIGR